jgi:hypothetical protein
VLVGRDRHLGEQRRRPVPCQLLEVPGLDTAREGGRLAPVQKRTPVDAGMTGTNDTSAAAEAGEGQEWNW